MGWNEDLEAAPYSGREVLLLNQSSYMYEGEVKRAYQYAPVVGYRYSDKTWTDGEGNALDPIAWAEIPKWDSESGIVRATPLKLAPCECNSRGCFVCDPGSYRPMTYRPPEVMTRKLPKAAREIGMTLTRSPRSDTPFRFHWTLAWRGMSMGRTSLDQARKTAMREVKAKRELDTVRRTG